MDVYLTSSRKKRISVKKDGHCLPRAVFRGAKHLNLISNLITYSALLKTVADGIKSDIPKYIGFITETEDSAKEALDSYITDKKYTLDSNIIDVVIFALANQTCEIKIHYQDKDGSFDMHLIAPDTSSRGVIELAFMSAHYDLIVKKVVKQEDTTTTSNFSMTLMPMTVEGSVVPLIESVRSNEDALSFTEPNVCLEPAATNDLTTGVTGTTADQDILLQHQGTSQDSEEHESDIESSVESENDSREIPHGIDAIKSRRGGKTYINPRIFDRVELVKSEKVPDDIDGICKYEIPTGDFLNNCKGCRPWGKIVMSKCKEFTAGPRLLLTCRGSYVCQNSMCENILDFGVNRSDFTDKNENTICSICDAEAKYIPCDARLFIEKDLERKISTVKHYGSHTCLVRKKGRPDTKEIEELIDTVPTITREVIIRQGVKRQLERNGVQAAVNAAKRFTDTKFIDNLLARRKSCHIHMGTALQQLKR